MAIKNVSGIACPVIRMACGYIYRLREPDTRNYITVNRDQLRKLALTSYGLKGCLFAPRMITKVVIKSGAI